MGEERELKFLENDKLKLTIGSLATIKRDLLKNRWNYFCHLSQRKKLRETNREKCLTRLKWKYIELERVPTDSPVLEKIIRTRRERRESKLARKKRMIEIIEKIIKEEFRVKKKLESKQKTENFQNSRQRNRKKPTKF
ncbi:uncharacterized protein LOC112494438 [Cephus cinctus]|uniref:Uncharacterized protein LOC112494438 n=1 Tax=Cephus cinctus TaxID=211228 RepID=A0AAJ7RIU9_CEPCN|nr:uncharacterized protein LOC112494438 [Cephus cinctus]